MYNDLITIGSFTLHTYGLMTAIGIIAAYCTAEYRAKKNRLDETKIFWFVIWCLVFGYACSKILYWITILPSIIEDPSILIRTLGDGWVVYGGILGGILGAYLFCRRHKLPTLKYFDIAIASVALAQGFGRLGCFFAGCCYGVETDSAFSIVFTNSAFAPNGVHLVPTQLISSALDFLLFVFLVLLYRRKKHIPGQCMAAYLICYSAGRFVLEFFRGDLIRGSVGIVSTSQFISIFTLFAGIVLLIIVNKRGNVYDILKYKAAIFDLDGTLLNTLESIAHPTNEALKQFGYEERPLEEYKSYVGNGYMNCVKNALAADGITDTEAIDKVYGFGSALYADDPTYNVKAYPEMKETLESLKAKGMKLAVITNKPHISAPAVIEEFFGKELFDIVQGRQDGMPVKPDPECVKGILEKLEVSPEECCYFGDSDTDMKLGKAAGFYTVGVAWGFRSREELEENDADMIIDEPEKIAEVC
jgi:phosphatidylglycerol:prolipoprotein diacylglycerol transferase